MLDRTTVLQVGGTAGSPERVPARRVQCPASPALHSIVATTRSGCGNRQLRAVHGVGDCGSAAQSLPKEADQPLLELLRVDRRRLQVLAILGEPGRHVHAGRTGRGGQLLGLVNVDPGIGAGVHDVDGAARSLADFRDRVPREEVGACDHAPAASAPEPGMSDSRCAPTCGR